MGKYVDIKLSEEQSSELKNSLLQATKFYYRSYLLFPFNDEFNKFGNKCILILNKIYHEQFLLNKDINTIINIYDNTIKEYEKALNELDDSNINNNIINFIKITINQFKISREFLASQLL